MKQEIISLEDFKNSNLYSDFIRENPSTGTLKVQVFTAYNAIPISDCEIVIFKTIGNKKVLFYSGMTDSSGIIDNIVLPAPKAVENLMDIPSYTIYDMSAIHVGYQTIKQYKIGMLGGIKAIQYVKMTPEVDLKEEKYGY